MPAPRNTLQWLRGYENLPTMAKVKRSRQGQGAPPIRIDARSVRPRLPSRAYGVQGPAGTQRGAQLPGWEFTPPTRKGMPGISQEPNSPWGVAMHDPLERQWVEMSPSGIPILRNRPMYTSQAQAYSGGGGGGWGSGYAPKSYGGGGGGWGDGGGYAQDAQNLWWDPGLYNWRYGASY